MTPERRRLTQIECISEHGRALEVQYAGMSRTMRRAAVVVLVLVLAGCGGSAGRPRPGAIVASRLGAGLYRIDPRTHSERRLSPADASDSQPAWSPDGRTILFVRETIDGAGLWLMDAGGRHVRKLHQADAFASPSWSPDGKHISYSGAVGGIRVLDVSTSETHHIARGYDEHPSWSPNGKRLVFTHDATGNGDYSIWTMRADGSDRRRLTHGGDDQEPVWSPDGRWIAFKRDNDVWLVDVASGNVRRLVRFADYPSWSPTGAQLLVFAIRRHKPRPQIGLFTVDIPSGRIALLAPGPWTDSSWAKA
jgi:Tol biopolymer transport system component